MYHLILIAFTALPQSSASIRDASWLTGCWAATHRGAVIREHWLPPDGGTMFGVSRTVAGGKTTEHEFIVLREGARGLEYVAKPARQAEALFVSTRADAGELVFENPTHDFPTRITYQRNADGIVAVVSGKVDGQPRNLEFQYRPVDCTR